MGVTRCREAAMENACVKKAHCDMRVAIKVTRGGYNADRGVAQWSDCGPLYFQPPPQALLSKFSVYSVDFFFRSVVANAVAPLAVNLIPYLRAWRVSDVLHQ